MNVGKSVRKAIDEMAGGDCESAMLHACNAVDGTARKVWPDASSNKMRFTTFLRDNFDVLGPMGAPGIDLVTTRFPVPSISSPTASGGQPDLADVIYAVHRCVHGHGDELPSGFDLIPDSNGPAGVTHLQITPTQVRLSDRIVYGLLAVAVLTAANSDQPTGDSYFLSYGTTHTFVIDEWWGRKGHFLSEIAGFMIPAVTLDFTEWMDF